MDDDDYGQPVDPIETVLWLGVMLAGLLVLASIAIYFFWPA